MIELYMSTQSYCVLMPTHHEMQFGEAPVDLHGMEPSQIAIMYSTTRLSSSYLYVKPQPYGLAMTHKKR